MYPLMYILKKKDKYINIERMEYMETLQKFALIFTIIGALVWGIIGIFDINIIDAIFQDMYIIARIIYIIVGICGIINIGLLFNHIEK